jgi:hypothetical protein
VFPPGFVVFAPRFVAVSTGVTFDPATDDVESAVSSAAVVVFDRVTAVESSNALASVAFAASTARVGAVVVVVVLVPVVCEGSGVDVAVVKSGSAVELLPSSAPVPASTASPTTVVDRFAVPASVIVVAGVETFDTAVGVAVVLVVASVDSTLVVGVVVV